MLDGGTLLHRTSWTTGKTYGQIFDQYTAYIIKWYGKAILVFDGYNDVPNTNGCAHMRRSGSATYRQRRRQRLETKKEEFPYNKMNKQRFIGLRCSLRDWKRLNVIYTRQEETLMCSLCKLQSPLQLRKKPSWLERMQICWYYSSTCIMQAMSYTTSSSGQNTNEAVRKERSVGTFQQ